MIRFYIFVGFILSVKVSAECLNGFELHGNGCFKVEALEASWIEAKMYCQLLGSDLVVIGNETEEAIIEGFLSKFHSSHIDESYWLAGTDIANENVWRWMLSDGVSSPIVYTNWGHGNPDNVGGNQNCLALRYNKGHAYWVDDLCNAQHSFICKTTPDGGRLDIVG